MGKLDTSRMSNATKIGRVDNAHNELENDLGEILGVPDNTIITSPIFGVTGDGSNPVNSDGSLKGVMKFIADVAATDAADAMGFEFADGEEIKRLVFESSGLKIYRMGDTDWELVADIENPSGGTGILQNLADVDIDTMVAGKILGTNVSLDFELQDPPVGTGKSRYVDLSDTPADYGATPFAPSDVDKLVYVASQSTLGLIDQPEGLGPQFVMMLQAPSVGSGETYQSWGSNEIGYDMYQWGYQPFDNDGGLLTDDTALLTDGAGANYDQYVTLEKGIYEVSFWFSTATATQFGVREWWVEGSNSDGPATYGATQRPNTLFIGDASQFIPTYGIQSLGTKTLIQFADGTISFKAKQNSGQQLTGCNFYVVISKVK